MAEVYTNEGGVGPYSSQSALIGDDYVNGSPVYSNIERAQEFTPDFDATITSVSIYCIRVVDNGGSFPGTLTASIYSGSPGGDVLYTGTVDRQTAPDSEDYLSVSLTGSAVLYNGDTYYVVVSDPAGHQEAVPFDAEEEYIRWLGKTATIDPGTSWWKHDAISWTALTSQPEFLSITVYGDAASAAPSKATNPTPTDSATPGVDFSDYTLSWEDGGGADTYNLVAVSWDGYSGTVASGLTEPTYTFGSTDPLRPSGISAVLQWRVDSVNDEGTTTGDTWQFDPRPAKVTTPSPADDTTSQGIYLATLGWATADQADTYKVYFEQGANDYVGETADTSIACPINTLARNTAYPWRVDSANIFGTTTGDTWTLTTLALAYPIGSYELIDGGDTPDAGGTPGEDFYWTGENNMATIHRLIALAGNAIWYTEY